MKKRNILILLTSSLIFNSSLPYAQNPGFQIEGTGFGVQQRITDTLSGNSLILQSGSADNLKITGYNYKTATGQPLYLSVDGANTILNPNGGGVGIGTTPLAGYLFDVAGPVRSFGNTTHFVSQTTGGTNSWARYYMRSSAQSWFIGTSQNFNGNQLYIGDETNNQTRFSIQPGGGPIYMQGNITQDVGSYGMPKAMVYLNSNGTIGRCYNGLTGATTGGCGFTSVRIGTGDYRILFPFVITSSFFAVNAELGCCPGLVSISYDVYGSSELSIGVLYKLPNEINPDPTDLPAMVIVY